MAASLSSVANNMVTGLLVESTILGVFLLAFFLTAFLLISRPTPCPKLHGRRGTRLAILALMMTVAVAHEVVAILCTTEHIASILPNVTPLAVQTMLYVTQTAFTLILLLHRLFTRFKDHTIYFLPLIGLSLLAVTPGYRAAYDVYESSVGPTLALDPSSNPALLYTQPALGEYTTCIIVFTATSIIISVVCNAFLFSAVIKARKAASLSVIQLIFSTFIDTGVLITAILGTMLPVQLFLKTGVTFLFEGASTPALALVCTTLVLTQTTRLSFDSPRLDDIAGSPKGIVIQLHSSLDVEKGSAPSITYKPSQRSTEKSSSNGWSTRPEPSSPDSPREIGQARQAQNAQAVTGGQLPSGRPTRARRALARLSRTLQPSSRLREVVSAEDVSMSPV